MPVTSARNRPLPLLALCLLALPLLCACPDTRPKQRLPGPTDPGGEWVRPYDGYLPDDPPEGMTVLHVIDEVTREPIRGARIRQCLEIDVGQDGWGPVIAEGTTDAFGLAWIEVPDRGLTDDGIIRESHWMVHAPGYAAMEEYGGQLEETIELARPRTRHGRIVDSLGRPLAHAAVGYKEGCGHAPFLVTTTTDANGVFVLSGVDGRGDIFYSGRGLLGSYYRGTLRTLDQTPDTHVASACRRFEGRIVGADLDHLAPRMIHATAESRGVFSRIADDGTFVLDGALGDGLISLWCRPNGWTLELPTDRWRPGHPFVWDVSLGKRDPNESETIAFRRLVVEVLGPDGTPLPGTHWSVVAYRVDDGIEADFDDRDGDDDDVPGAPPALSLLPGTYDVELHADDHAYVEPVRVVIGKDDPPPLTLHAKLHPMLDIAWEGIEEGEEPRFDVSYANADGIVDHEAHRPDDDTWLPAGVLARVAVHWPGRTTFHDIGPAVDGVRRVVIRPPTTRRIRFGAPFEPQQVYLGGDDLGPVTALGENRYQVETPMLGTLALVVEAEEGERYEPMPYIRTLITLDEDSPAEIDLGMLHVPDAQRERGHLTLLDADGSPLDDVRVDVTAPVPSAEDEPFIQHVAFTDEEGVAMSHAFLEGAVVTFELDDDDGRYEFSRALEGPGPWTIRRGSGVIELEVHGPWGLLQASSVMLDGSLEEPTYTEDDEPTDDRDVPAAHKPARYVLDKLSAGPHTLIITAPGHRGEVRRVILEPGETRRIRVDLPERK